MAVVLRNACAPISDPSLPPGDAEIRAALERIATSQQLRGAPRLVAFLRYAVERTLAGRSSQIKSYTIAVEALAREPSFDPQTDPIVRVEASRLRHALARYYGGDGRDDPILIDFPRGSYIPLFRERHLATSRRSDDGASLQTLFGRLVELHRQLELVTAEIERACNVVEQAARPPRRRG
jgi:hypothetical protein